MQQLHFQRPVSNGKKCLPLTTPSSPLAALRAAGAATLSTLTASSFQASVLIGQNGGVRRSGDTSIPNCFTKYIAVRADLPEFQPPKFRLARDPPIASTSGNCCSSQC